MNKCIICGAYMSWSYEKGWYCSNGCVIKTSVSNRTEILKHPTQTTNTNAILAKENNDGQR